MSEVLNDRKISRGSSIGEDRIIPLQEIITEDFEHTIKGIEVLFSEK
jgi:hypothetical protein